MCCSHAHKEKKREHKINLRIDAKVKLTVIISEVNSFLLEIPSLILGPFCGLKKVVQ
jgi:hypothetical protein